MTWNEGEPAETGHYLVQVRTQGHPEGNPWVFLAKVLVDPKLFPNPVYTDHHGGNDKWRQYRGGQVVGWCDPTPENFASAFAELQEFYNELER